MIKRLRVKFVCITMTLVMAMLMVIFGLVYHFTASGLESDSLSALKAASHNQPRPGRPGEFTQPVFTLQEGPRGELIVGGSDWFDLTDEEQLLDIYTQASDRKQEHGILEEFDLRFYRSEHPMGISVAFADISGERAALQNLVQNFILIGLVGFAGFLAISILLARWMVKPVETAWQQQRQFVADASHELKTPLTVILTNAELLQSPDYSQAERQRFSDSILIMSRKMRGLVENLLQLARVDNGQTGAEKVSVNLSQLTEEALLPFEPVYFEAGIALRGVPRQLRQVIEILLDNGRKYSACGSTCTVTLARQGRGRVQLRFFSPGTPLSAQQCQDVFKRFYRADEARAMSGSYGLGLSIAQRIVEDHGGKIWAQAAEKGNLFFVTLPEL